MRNRCKNNYIESLGAVYRAKHAVFKKKSFKKSQQPPSFGERGLSLTSHTARSHAGWA